MYIVAITGCKGSGKSFFAEQLKRQLTIHTAHEAFIIPLASTLKGIIAYLSCWDMATLEDPVLKETAFNIAHGPTLNPRKAMQAVGNFFRELFGPDVWVRALEKKIPPNATVVIVPDMRFENEYAFFKNPVFRLVHVHIHNVEAEAKVDGVDLDVSELGWKTFGAKADVTVLNFIGKDLSKVLEHTQSYL